MWLFAGMLIVACIETATLGMIALFASSVTDPEYFIQSVFIVKIREFINAPFLSSPVGIVLAFSVVMATMVILKNLTLFIYVYCSSFFSNFVNGILGRELLTGFLQRPYEWYLSQNSADMILVMTWRNYFGSFIKAILELMSNSLIITFLFISLIVVEPTISISTIILLGATAYIIFRKIRPVIDYTASARKDQTLAINRENATALQGIRDIKLTGLEGKFIKYYQNEVDIFVRLNAKEDLFVRIPALLLETLGFTLLAICIWMLLYVKGESTARITGTVTLLAVTAWRVMPALNRLLASLSTIRSALPYVDKMLSYFLPAKPEKKVVNLDTESCQKSLPFRHSIKLKDIHFFFAGMDSPVLQNINCNIRRGQTVGIIGTSGAGKSTFVDIIAGLLSPTEGNVLIDDQTLDTSNLCTWMKKIGYVSQAPYIYDGTLAENVAFGSRGSEIDLRKVVECCHKAALQDVIDELPEGVDTQIGERGIKLSGGQRQRVTIARALYNNPEILIFDEATSALDSFNEKAIQSTIRNLKGEQTLIVVAHRLSTVEECDLLIWIEKGEIRKIATPGEILPLYQENMNDLQV